MGKKFTASLIVIALAGAGGAGYIYYQQSHVPAATAKQTGELNTSSIQAQQKKQAAREKAANQKHYQIPKIKNHATQAIKSANGLPSAVSSRFNDGLTQTFAYLSSPDLLIFKNQSDSSNQFVPKAFKLGQYYANRDAINAGVEAFNQTISKDRDPSAKVPRPGDTYEINTFNIKNVKNHSQNGQTVYQFDYDTVYSIKNNQFKYHLAGNVTLNERGQIMSITAQPAK